ncbi:hypothetical protein [Colwellia psychrerythraea]|uniref:hypothetical protein n=1 Tax=Colwellia psychrerythraea TaxID=28229 RepID=UPI001E582BF6|nr:hypothetical protein [Colwellia psychrerythraea]
MRVSLIIILLSIITACKGSGDSEEYISDDYFGVWHSPCKQSDNSELYVAREYIISAFVIELNSYGFKDMNCLTPSELIPFFHAGDIEYYDYDFITTLHGYEARWYDSYVQPIDTSLDSINYEVGFYLEGETLYEVVRYTNIDEYGVVFTEPYSRQ